MNVRENTEKDNYVDPFDIRGYRTCNVLEESDEYRSTKDRTGR